MEVLRPLPSPSPPMDRYRGAISPSSLRLFLQRKREGHVGGGSASSSSSPAGGDKFYIAVGRSPEKTLGLLRWTFRRFAPREIGLLHVHQPSPLIPTLLGKIPVNQANEELVSSFRRTEWETTKKTLLNYMSYCHRSQVRATVILTETEQIQSGIVDLVAQHGIRRLIMGSTPDSCFKLKTSSSKAFFTAKNAPPFCEIWFVNKGIHIWTREARESTECFVPVSKLDESDTRGRFGLSPQNLIELMLNKEYGTSNSLLSTGILESRGLELSNNTEVIPEDFSAICVTNLFGSQESASLPTVTSLPSSPSSFLSEMVELSEKLKEVTEQIERSKKASFVELVKRKQVESEVEETLNRVKASEDAQQHEAQIRRELQDLLRVTKLQREELVNQREKTMKELQNVIDTIAILESRTREMALQRAEAAEELNLIQSSIEFLDLEKQKNQKLRGDDRSHIWSLETNNDSLSSNVQAATCEFSESFKSRQLNYGCIYKGELLCKTVMIKKSAPSFFLCPILQEIMQDPQVATDGFTYERKALQDWLDSGRDTSPMTNLKLKHLNLTPNHALRFAILDWLRQS